MASPVVVKFVVEGVAQVQLAFKTIEQAVLKAEGAQLKAAQSGSKERIAIADKERKEKERLYASMFKDIETKEKTATKAADKEAKERTRNADQAEKNMIRMAEKSASDKAAIRAKDLANFVAVEKAKTRANEREAKARADAEERAQESVRRRYARALGTATATGLGNGLSRAVGMGTSMVQGLLNVGGGFGISDSVARSVSLSGRLADISNRGVVLSSKNEKNRNRVGVKELEGDVRGTAIRYGLSSDTVAGGLDKFASKTGDLDTGRGIMGDLAVLSRAGGGSFDDLADAAGDVANAMGDMQNKGPKVMEIMRAMAVQGGVGAVEMKDLAVQMAKIGASSGRFAGGAEKNLITMGALVQLARASGGAPSAASAATGLVTMSSAFSKAKKLEGFEYLTSDKNGKNGLSAKNEQGFTRDFEEILNEAMRGAATKSAASGKGLQNFDVLMGTVFGDERAKKPIEPLMAAFKNAYAGAKGSESDKISAGLDASKALIDTFRPEGNRDLENEFKEKAAYSLKEDPGARIQRAAEEFDKAISEKLVPKLLDLMPLLSDLIPLYVQGASKFADVIKTVAEFVEAHQGMLSYIADHPLGAMIFASISESIAKAAIGEGIRDILMGGLKSGGGAGGALGGAGAAGGAGLVGVAVAATALTYASAYNSYGDKEDAAIKEGKRNFEKNPLDTYNAAQQRLTGDGATDDSSDTLDQIGKYFEISNPLGWMFMAERKVGDYVKEEVTGLAPDPNLTPEGRLASKEAAEAVVALWQNREVKHAIAISVSSAMAEGISTALVTNAGTTLRFDGGPGTAPKGGGGGK